MSTVLVRATADTDDLDAVHSGDGFWLGTATFRDRLGATPPGVRVLDVVAEVGRTLAGHAFLIGIGAARDGYGISAVYVSPNLRRRGAGRALVEVLAATAGDLGLPGVVDHAREDDTASLAAAERLGYTVLSHHRESQLDLTRLDAAALERLAARVEAAGITLRALPDDADDSDWARAHEVFTTVSADAPDVAGAGDSMPLPVFRRFMRQPYRVLLAWSGDRPVGITCVTDHAEDGAVNTVLTGVRREARGQGVATGLKARHALLLAAHGHRRVVTQNMAGNDAIIAANERLGFLARPGLVTLGRAVDAATPGR